MATIYKELQALIRKFPYVDAKENYKCISLDIGLTKKIQKIFHLTEHFSGGICLQENFTSSNLAVASFGKLLLSQFKNSDTLTFNLTMMEVEKDTSVSYFTLLEKRNETHIYGAGNNVTRGGKTAYENMQKMIYLLREQTDISLRILRVTEEESNLFLSTIEEGARKTKKELSIV